MQKRIKSMLLLSALAIVVVSLIGSVDGISSSVSVNVIDTRDLSIEFVKIDAPQNIAATALGTTDFVRRTYPLSDDGLDYDIINTNFPSLLGSECESSPTSSEACLIDLHVRIISYVALSGGFPERVVAVVPQGWFPNNTAHGTILGHAKPPFKSVIIEEGYRSLLAHELGHTYYFCEEYADSLWSKQNNYFSLYGGCKNGDFNPQDEMLDSSCSDESTGCDVYTFGKLVPWNSTNGLIKMFNFMGYGDFNQDGRWVSEDSYLSLLEEFSHSTPEFASSRVFISGKFNESSGHYQLNNFYTLGPGLAENRSDFTTGNFTIDFRDSENNSLYNLSFNMPGSDFNLEENQTQTNISGFAFVFPFQSDVAEIVFKENSIADVNFIPTPNTPSLEFVSNFSGQTFFRQMFNVSWNASDIDGGEIAYAVLFSSDNGSNYTTLEVDYNQTFLELNSSNFPDCSSCRIKVLATDGINTNSTVSEPFSIVSNLPPNVQFVAPTPSNGSGQGNSNIYVNLSTFDVDNHYSFVDFNEDVLLWLRFDDVTENGSLVDLSSYTKNLSAFGNSSQVTGKFGEGFSFDGVGDYISTSSTEWSSASAPFSISVWVNYTGNGSYDSLFSWGTYDPAVYIETAGESLNLNWYNGEDNYLNISTTADRGTYHHLVLVRNSNNSIRVYWDGLDKGILATDSIALSGKSLTMAYDTFSGDEFVGELDEILIFNRSLSLTEVGALFNSSDFQYSNNFLNLSYGNYSFIGHAVDSSAEKNSTENRFVSISSEFPTDNYKFYVKNASGSNLAWFGDLGNVVLKGQCFAQSNCVASAGSWIIGNSTDSTVAYINSTGDLCIEKGDCSDFSASCNPTRNAFVVKDSGANNVSYIDFDGDLCLTGELFENEEI